MKCNDFQQKLSDYAEGIIPSEEQALIEEHLKSCSTCTEFLADMKRTMSYARDLENIEPPAWLREKVMSRIKTETEPKKGFLQKLFYPLHIKIPIEAVTVVFIAVTALYIFKTIQPEVKIAKTPSEVKPQIFLQKKETPQENAKSDEIVIPSPAPAIPMPPEKALPPSPSTTRGHLEKVPPLSPSLEKTIPSSPPLERGGEGRFETEQTMPSEKPVVRNRMEESPQVPTPSHKQNEVIPSAGALDKDELKTGASSRSGEAIVSAERRKSVVISLRVKDIETAREEIEETLINLDGKIVGTQFIENNEILDAEIDSQNLKGLFANLKRVGHVTKKEADLREFDGKIDLTIKILRQ
jgi:hypothetical protein